MEHEHEDMLNNADEQEETTDSTPAESTEEEFSLEQEEEDVAADEPDTQDDMDTDTSDEDTNDESDSETLVDEEDEVDGEDTTDNEESEDTEDDTLPEESLLPLENVVEAIIFAARSPLKIKQIAKCVGKRTRVEDVKNAIDTLNQQYFETERAFEIVELAERYQLMSRPEYAPHIQALLGKALTTAEKEKKLTPTALDTLSIIAYKQPITRQEVEAVRGVGCGNVLRQLIERGTIRVIGRKTDVIGYPPLYGTTEEFLKEFGLGTLEQLPMVNELRRITGTEAPLPDGSEPVEEESPQLTLLPKEPSDDETAPSEGADENTDDQQEGDVRAEEDGTDAAAVIEDASEPEEADASDTETESSEEIPDEGEEEPEKSE